MLNSFFSVIVLTGGPSRPHLTAKCIDSINSQSFPNIQKILVNNGRLHEDFNLILNPYQNDSIYNNPSRLQDWEVIHFKDSKFDPDDHTSIWEAPGIAAMKIAKGKYSFFINDDDFLDTNFFLQMHNSFLKYPAATTAFGLPINYQIDKQTLIYPVKGSWEKRPEYEDGINVSYNWLKYDPTYHPNPGFSFICETEKVKRVEKTFFSGGFPDISPLIQIVPFGMTIFNKNALMYLGRHEKQQRHDWDNEHKLNLKYKKSFEKMLNLNLEALDNLSNKNSKLEKLVKNYFMFALVESSFYVFYDFIFKKISMKETNISTSVAFKHFSILLKRPKFFLINLYNEFRKVKFIKNYF